MELIPKYKQELVDLEAKMLAAQKFAEKFPAFAEGIIAHKFTEEFTGKIGDRYKGLYYSWGINRYFYREKSNITNYRGDFSPQYLWCVYINQLSIFGDSYVETCLGHIEKEIDLFFYDPLNTNFYATDDQLMGLLDALADWYVSAKVINDQHRIEKKKATLIAELEKLSNQTTDVEKG